MPRLINVTSKFLSLKGGWGGSFESTLVKMSNCWKSHAAAQMSSEIKLLERTEVYYCFNPKGDNFNVDQL